MKPLRQFDLNLLIIFEALVAESHVSRAAEKVFLSQSAMSHALNRLREHLGDPILVRTGNGLQPTPRAVKMLPEVRKALRLVEQTLNPPQPFDAQNSKRTFRIASTDYFETVIFPDWFSQLNQQAPGLKVEIDLIVEESVYSRLEQGSLDLIVGMDAGLPFSVQLNKEPWIKEKQVCLAGQKNPLIAEQLDLQTYIEQQHIVFFDIGGETHSSIDRWLDSQGLERVIISRTTNYMAAARMVANSHSIITLPYRMALLYCDMLPVRIVQPPAGIPEVEMTLMQHPLYADDPAIIWLKQAIKTHTLNQM